MKKTALISIVLSVALFAGSSMPPMPPMPPSLGGSSHHQKKEHNTTPKECDLLPPMVIFLPPPMEKQLDKCKNALYKPKKEFAQKQLTKMLKKKVIIISIKTLEKFSKLYKIEYKEGTLLCNSKVTACIKQ